MGFFSKQPKYRLEPDTAGTYYLQRWEGSFIGYLSIRAGVTKESADEYIKNLERETVYYREEE